MTEKKLMLKIEYAVHGKPTQYIEIKDIESTQIDVLDDKGHVVSQYFFSTRL